MALALVSHRFRVEAVLVQQFFAAPRFTVGIAQRYGLAAHHFSQADFGVMAGVLLGAEGQFDRDTCACVAAKLLQRIGLWREDEPVSSATYRWGPEKLAHFATAATADAVVTEMAIEELLDLHVRMSEIEAHQRAIEALMRAAGQEVPS